MLHEVMHTIGLVATCAPHQYLAGHVSDSPHDLMWAGDAPWSLPAVLDVGRDDYYLQPNANCPDLSRRTNTASPAIAGAAEAGKTVTASQGTWVATWPLVYAYRWQRCDSSGAACEDIVGASGATYTIGARDVGSRIRVVVTLADLTGSTSAASEPTAAVLHAQSHPGPPSLARSGHGTLRARRTGAVAIVSTTVTVDEVARVRVRALKTATSPIPLLRGSRLGTAVLTAPAGAVSARAGAGEALRVTVRLAMRRLTRGRTYRLGLVATDLDGDQATLRIPFRR
jgi:hypothetical protein